MDIKLPSLKPKRMHALYCRVSTLDQKFGLESQARALREYCKMKSITNYEFYGPRPESGRN